MEDQIPASQAPEPAYNISPEELEAMKAYAREQAIRMTYQQPPLPTQPSQPAISSVPQWPPTPEVLIPKMPKAPEPAYDFSAPKVIYVRRNLTVAEILVICVLSCAVVGGIQGVWGLASKYLPQIEVRVK
jgi:hypothetical protein